MTTVATTGTLSAYGTGTDAARGEASQGVALTCEEVAVALRCPVCGTPTGEVCEHPLSRFRAALRWVAERNGR